MKIRHGFISNSSASSFCIFGTEIPEDMVEEVEKYINEHKLNLDVECGPERESVYIGRSYSSIGDDETGKQFKTSIQDAVLPMFIDLKINIGGKTDFGRIEEAWCDG